MLSWNCCAFVTRPSITSKHAMSRLVSTAASHAAKPRSSAQPELAALLRVELGRDQVLARDDGAELGRVRGDAEHVGGIGGRAVVRVHEVEVPLVGELARDGVLAP